MTGSIFRPIVLLPGQSFPKMCLYQELIVNTSRMISLSSFNNTFSAFITIGNSSYFIDGGNISRALEGIELSPYEDLVKGQNNAGVCGVAMKTQPFAQPLLDSKVTFVNSSMTDYYVELYVVADNAMYAKWGSATEATIYTVINYVNALYRGQGVHIFVVAIEIWKTSNPFSITSDSMSTLLNLSAYRTTLTTRHDVIHLISGVTFSNGILGLAYIGGMCQFTYGAGLTTDRSETSFALTASTMTHEMGHNFGLNHDTDECSCSPDSYCLMNAYSYPNAVGLKWSNCSLSALSQNLPLLQSAKCLQNVPNLLTITNANLCGNGVVDANEDCDPGVWTSSSNCCDPTTCKFTSGAECASGRCCNKTTCQPLTRGTQCRAASNQCDLPEFCDGVTEFCPDDRYKLNAIPCDGNQGYCYNGYCSSHNLQCQQIFSPSSSSSSDQCYSLNGVDGSLYYGFCSYAFAGFPESTAAYIWGTCASSNVKCGLLHCTNYSTNEIYSPFTKTVNSEVCYQGIFNANLTEVRDPTMVQDGSSCGFGRWCVNSVCQSADSIPSGCSCSGHGVCNDLGNCHCDTDLSNATCSTSGGCGGSVDSGPPCQNVTVPSTCPTNYCQNGGTCILNTDGSQCSFGAPYCCRCSGIYLEPNCAKPSSKTSLLMITSATTFLPDYANPSSDAFKQFELNLCQMVRVSFQRYLGSARFSCQLSNITAGSSIGATIIQGDSSLPSNGYVIADSITKFCRLNNNISQSLCNNSIVKFASVTASSGTPTNSCAVANLCPTSPLKYICIPIDGVTYVCSCPAGYRNVTSTTSIVAQCTEICYSNVSQCSNNGICQENSGSSVTCVCNSRYSGKRCETSITPIIIGVVVGVGLFLILLLIIIIVSWRRGCCCFSTQTLKLDSSTSTRANAPQQNAPENYSVYVVPNGTEQAQVSSSNQDPPPPYEGRANHHI